MSVTVIVQKDVNERITLYTSETQLLSTALFYSLIFKEDIFFCLIQTASVLCVMLLTKSEVNKGRKRLTIVENLQADK